MKKLKRKITKRRNYEYPFSDDGGLHNPNINFVCFDCRFVTRDKNGQTPTCPHCGKQMTNVFCRDEIPRKTNNRGWKLLERKHGWMK